MAAQSVSIPNNAHRACDLTEVDYEDAFEMYIPNAGKYSADTWAKEIFQNAPKTASTVINTAWSIVGLKSWSETFEQLLNTKTNALNSNEIVLTAHSDRSGLEARLVIYVTMTTVGIATFIKFEKKYVSRIVWQILRPAHREFAPYLLESAAKRNAE